MPADFPNHNISLAGWLILAKKFLTYDEQICKLQNEKELVVPDISYAKKHLEELSYYSLVSGYKSLFKHGPSGKYLRGVSLDEIVAFYYFDEELRTLFLKYILHVERHIKSLISYYFCEKYGENQKIYLDSSNFSTVKKNRREVERLIRSMQKRLSLPSPYHYIAHHVKKYQNVPLWVAMNAFTFGQVSAFYQYMPNDIQVKVSKHFPGYSEKQLHQFITIVAKCRNVCAHNERLYNFHTSAAIPDTLLHKKLSIPERKGSYIQGKHDLFAIVLALRYLISNEDFKAFKHALVRLISHTLRQCPHISFIQLAAEMGFPVNWEKITRYKYN